MKVNLKKSHMFVVTTFIAHLLTFPKMGFVDCSSSHLKSSLKMLFIKEIFSVNLTHQRFLNQKCQCNIQITHAHTHVHPQIIVSVYSECLNDFSLLCSHSHTLTSAFYLDFSITVITEVSLISSAEQTRENRLQ